MIYEIFVYFFVIFGMFSFVMSATDMIFSRKHEKDIFSVTHLKQSEDIDKIIYLAKKYNHTIYVVCSFYDKTALNYIKDRYFNVKFIDEER